MKLFLSIAVLSCVFTGCTGGMTYEQIAVSEQTKIDTCYEQGGIPETKHAERVEWFHRCSFPDDSYSRFNFDLLN